MVTTEQVIQCAIALKEFCENNRCDQCPFDTSKTINGTTCRMAQSNPSTLIIKEKTIWEVR